MTPMAGLPILERPTDTKTPRSCARQRVEALMYVELGPENGGFPINISEEGMTFQGVRPLQKDQEICATFKLHGTGESVTAVAKIVWLTESRKGGGLQFIDLPESSRRLINDWMSLQRNDSGPRKKPAAAMSRLGAKDVRYDRAVPLVADHCKPPAQTTTIAATQPLNSLPLAGEAGLAITGNVASKAIGDVKKDVPKQHSHAKADLKRPSQISTPLKKNEKKSTRIRSYAFVLGPAISIAIMLISIAMLWPLHGALLAHFVSANPAPSDVQAVSASSAALPLERTVVVEPSSDPTIFESLPLTPIADVQENLTRPFPLDVAMSAPSHPAKNPAPLAPQSNHGVTSGVLAHATTDFHPAAPTIVPARSEQSVTVPPNPISKDTTEIPGSVNAGENTSSLPAKLPENLVSATGSIEIISDLYPSIRVPAESKRGLSRPGASLQIGRLVTKVEPVYPQEALRQRISGTTKVHVVIGRNGVVDKAELLDGPALLAEAVLRAVQQWVYQPTLLGGEPTEVEEDINVVFRITSPPASAN
jgi:TonB family protein